MAAHLVRLRFAQARAAFRARPVAASFVVLGSLLLAAGIVAGALALRAAPAETSRVAIIVLGALAALGFFVAPLASSRSDPLDPASFALLPVSPGGLSVASALAGLLSLPVAILTAGVVGAAIVGVSHGTAVWVAVVGGALHVLVCVLLARLGYAVSERVRVGGRSREGVVIGTLVAIAVVVPLAAYALSESWHAGAPELAVAVADTLALTPIGAAVAATVAGDAVAGPLAVAAASVIVGGACWWLVTRRALSAPPGARGASRAGPGWLGIFPRTATGAIAGRSVIYWATDVRYLANVAIVPIAGLLPVVPILVAGVPAETAALVPLPIIAAFLGWIAHNDLAYDSEAVWMHLVSSVRGAADRAGRLVPVALVAVPLLSATIALTAAFADAWDHVPALTGVALALTLAGFGLSSVSSVVAPYAVARPGDSPFRQPQRTGVRGVFAPGLVLLLTIAASIPALIGGFRAVVEGSGEDLEVLAMGAGTGLGVLIVGIFLGGFVFDKRGHRLIDVGRLA